MGCATARVRGCNHSVLFALPGMVGFWRTSWLVAVMLVGSSCRPICILGRDHDLRPGGLYVAHVDPRGCEGCEQLERGDLIQSVDGEPVVGELAGLTDGSPHELEVWKQRLGTVETVTITRTALTQIWTVDAALPAPGLLTMPAAVGSSSGNSPQGDC